MLYFDHDAYDAREIKPIRDQLLIQQDRELRRLQEIFDETAPGLASVTQKFIHFLSRQDPIHLAAWLNTLRQKYKQLPPEYSEEQKIAELISIYHDLAVYIPLLQKFDWGQRLVDMMIRVSSNRR